MLQPDQHIARLGPGPKFVPPRNKLTARILAKPLFDGRLHDQILIGLIVARRVGQLQVVVAPAPAGLRVAGDGVPQCPRIHQARQKIEDYGIVAGRHWLGFRVGVVHS